MAIQLVVFDMSGTTVEDGNGVQVAFVNAFKNADIEVSLNEANEVMGYPKPVAIRTLLEQKLADHTRITEEFIQKIHQDFVKGMIHFYETSADVREKKGARATFLQLKEKGIKTALNTGFSRNIADVIIRRLAWHEVIDFSVTSDEVERGRPHPDMIFRAMKATGVSDARQVAKVGDTISDIQEGRAAHCGLVVSITSGYYGRDVLAKENPDYLIAELPELLDLL